MHKIVLTALFWAMATICSGQTMQIKYFNNRWLEKEVPEKKAGFSQTTIYHADSTVTREIKDLKKDEIVSRKTFKENEPYGVWTGSFGKGVSTLDYNFPLVYADEKCDTVPFKTNDYFRDNDSLGYKAPVMMDGESTVYQFISRNIIYPPMPGNRAFREPFTCA